MYMQYARLSFKSYDVCVEQTVTVDMEWYTIILTLKVYCNSQTILLYYSTISNCLF